ncbi:flavin reductase family protein [Saccharothrix syringae]|uniref:Flavin reductase n=1 Tax=Saccharothrix syringae TaxID=103733 RepID=A0A5Q0H4Y9_SACSY|nr:flavin reductase family protein [Saccharothrix syringae]QFZ21267.1 flavin reductase [Saccharothrix syringae]
MTDPAAELGARGTSATAVDPARFRPPMSGFPGGVTTVTTAGPGGRARGTTCSSWAVL